MRIAQISNLYPPETIGGAEKYVRNISYSLTDRGHQVDVISTAASSRGSKTEFTKEDDDGVGVWRVTPLNVYAPYEHRDVSSWMKPFQHVIDLWNPQTYYLLKKLLKNLSPDVIHTHNFGGLSPSIFKVVGDHDATVVHTLHDYRLLDIRPDLYLDGKILEGRKSMAPFRAYNRAMVSGHIDRVLSPSQFVIDLHEKYGFFDQTETTKVPLGKKIGGSRDTYWDDSKGFKLLFVGQVSDAKGVCMLANAVKNIGEPDISLDILGKGPKLDEVKRIADSDERIAVHGFVSEEELNQFYREANATVVPSQWYDNSPMVIYESYSFGTPVIGSKIGGIPELIEEGSTGLLFEYDSQKDLVDSIISARDTFDQKMTSAVKEKSQELSMKSHMDRIESIYR